MKEYVLIRLGAPQYDRLSDTRKGNELFIVFPFIVHESNTRIVCRFSAHENENITGAGASVQVPEEVPNVSLFLL